MVGCATTPKPEIARARPRPKTLYDDGDGLTCDTRVIIHSKTEPGGLAAECSWLHAKYPGYKLQSASLGQCGAAVEDVVSITTADGRTLEIHFDVSSFYDSA
jgi:hypothetical protein